MALLNGIFRGDPPGTVVDLGAQGSMLQAHQDMDAAVRQQVRPAAGSPRCRPAATKGLGVGVVALAFFGIVHAGAVGAAPRGGAAARHRHGRGGPRQDAPRAAHPEGRAWTDQVEGFQKYLATAEADQLRFEEGEDIFSRYLPWAIVFGLADRWAKVCGDLVAMGRHPRHDAVLVLRQHEPGVVQHRVPDRQR